MLAIIPARGGSKRLPGKNTRLLAGQPLISYTINAARDSRIFDKVIVSTDDKNIAEVAVSFDADVPFLRPSELASDEAKSVDVVVHALEWLDKNEGYVPEEVTLLQPTSPFRAAEDIIAAYEVLKIKKAYRLISLRESDEHYHWMCTLVDDYTKPIMGEFADSRSQDLEDVYSLNGAIYMAKRDIILKEKSFFGPNTVGFVMSRIHSIDIDDNLDFLIAETIIEKGFLEI